MFYTLIAYRPTGDDRYGSITYSDHIVAVVATEGELIDKIAEWETVDFIDDALAQFSYTVVHPNGFVDDEGQWKHAITAEAKIRIDKIKEQRANKKAQEEQAKAVMKRQADLALLDKLQSQYGPK